MTIISYTFVMILSLCLLLISANSCDERDSIGFMELIVFLLIFNFKCKYKNYWTIQSLGMNI